MSSPTIWMRPPCAAVWRAKPAQSFSSSPSSIETIGKRVDPFVVERDHLVARLAAALRLGEVVGAAREERARRRIERDGDVLAGLVAGRLDRLDDQFARFLVAAEIGREAALVADRGRVALALEQLGERVERLGAVAQRLGEARRADRHDHEFLEVDRVLGVLAAVDDVHHRHRQPRSRRRRRDRRRAAAAPTAPRRARPPSTRRGSRWRRARLVRRAVERQHQPVDLGLARRVAADHRRRDLLDDVRDRLQHALAAVARLVAVAQLDRLVLAGRGAGRNRGGMRSVVEADLTSPLDCRASREFRARRPFILAIILSVEPTRLSGGAGDRRNEGDQIALACRSGWSCDLRAPSRAPFPRPSIVFCIRTPACLIRWGVQCSSALAN